MRRHLRVVYDPLTSVRHGDAKSTSGENNFRGKTLSKSLSTLRAKIGFTGLVHGYIRTRQD
jgi:hypothetical protein